MYEVNGIVLSSSQFEELKALIECGPSKVCEFANNRLIEVESFVFNSDMVDIYLKLFSYGLIDGKTITGGFIFSGLTVSGRDFVADYEQQQVDKKRAVHSDRKFQLLTIALSVLASFLTSLLTRLFLP